jgi:hypothetical protein
MISGKKTDFIQISTISISCADIFSEISCGTSLHSLHGSFMGV